MADLGWVDWVLLAVTAASVIVGLVRGLVFEVLSLLGWVAAYVAAQMAAPWLAPHLPIGAPGSGLNFGASFTLVFIAALVGWMLLARLIRLLIHATPLTAVDRALGAVFGLARGVIVLLALATVISFTPAARNHAWQTSHGAAWLGVLLAGIKPILPAAVARHLPT